MTALECADSPYIWLSSIGLTGTDSRLQRRPRRRPGLGNLSSHARTSNCYKAITQCPCAISIQLQTREIKKKCALWGTRSRRHVDAKYSADNSHGRCDVRRAIPQKNEVNRTALVNVYGRSPEIFDAWNLSFSRS